MLDGMLSGRGVAVLRWLGDSIPEASTYRTSQALAAALGVSLRMHPLRRWQKSHAEILWGCKVQCSERQRWQSATAKSKNLKLHLSLISAWDVPLCIAVHGLRGWLRLHKFQIFFLHAARGRQTQVAPCLKTSRQSWAQPQPRMREDSTSFWKDAYHKVVSIGLYPSLSISIHLYPSLSISIHLYPSLSLY